MTSKGPGFVLPVDKPVGPTSHDVVRQSRRTLRERRIGHTGTLDPFASGLLLLCVGPTTRLSEYLTGLDKEYVATARLGETTNTHDLEGDVLERSSEWTALTREDIAEALDGFVGAIEQVPPQFSAKKVGGEAMHRKARRGEQVALPAVPVTIHEVSVEEVALPLVRFRIRCSSGTYVRAIARDLGEALGVGAHLTELRRTAIGRFRVEDAIAMEELGDQEAVAGARLDPLEALGHLPGWAVEADDVRRLAHGQPVAYHGPLVAGPIAVRSGTELIAVGHAADGSLKPSKVFA